MSSPFQFVVNAIPRTILAVVTCALVVSQAQCVKSQTAGNADVVALSLNLQNVPTHGMVVEPVDLAAFKTSSTPVVTSDGVAVPAQFVPDEDGATRGKLVLHLPRGGDWKLALRAGAPLDEPQPITDETHAVTNPNFTIEFDPRQLAGFPSKITFARTGRVFSGFRWNDRLEDAATGGYRLGNDKNATVEVVSDGPLCTVVRTRARYIKENGQAPPSQPGAIYDWFVWKDSPLVYLAARATQNAAVAWREHHFLELFFADQSFTRFAGGAPTVDKALIADKAGTHFSQWGALVEGENALAMLGGPSQVHDGRGDYGTYLHFSRPAAWFNEWRETERRMDAWFWIGGENPIQTLPTIAPSFLQRPTLVASTPQLETQIAALRKRAASLPVAERGSALWSAALAERAINSGDLNTATAYAKAELPAGVTLHEAGTFGLALSRSETGIQLVSVFDLRAGRELLAAGVLPLWQVDLRGPQRAPKTLSAAGGWNRVSVAKVADGLQLRWSEYSDEELASISVTAHAIADATASAWKWELNVENNNPRWSVTNAVFPQIALADAGAATRVLLPRGSGEVQADVANRGFTYSSTYPNALAAMQLMAVYHDATTANATDRSGLYFSMHDPHAATKTIAVKGDAATQAVRLSYANPAPNLGVPGNGFTLSGHAVWQIMRGDWFDAAQIYKAWAKQEADWWPAIGPEGRADTPLWMRSLSAWAQSNGEGERIVRETTALRNHWDVPVGQHWYNYNTTDFDNDYPHWLPPQAELRPGFREGIETLKKNGMFAMPYINARLWDTRDRRLEDFEYTKFALPHTVKREDSNGTLAPQIETYESKESDGSPVRMAVMCPASEFYQKRIADISARFFNEFGMNGMYYDQIGASEPVLCMDASHGHPLGGGTWWAESYNEMLLKIRQDMPAGRILTTESNAEPFMKNLDGYLVWNWNYPGQVAAFPAVYGGAIQMFGRAYRGGEGKALANRMKSAQQLAWGEQIGWGNPDVLIKDSGAVDFMKRAVQLRQQFARYFYAGQMGRPPQLVGNVPTVTADWDWVGPVTTDAVISGSWSLPQSKKMLVVFSNVSDAPVFANFDLKAHLKNAVPNLPAKYTISPVRLEGDVAPPALGLGKTKLSFAPQSTVAWEIKW